MSSLGKRVTITFVSYCSTKEINRTLSEEVLCELENITDGKKVEWIIK